jgi:hypothetical protein
VRTEQVPPCLMELRDDFCFPSADFGPADLAPLVRAAATLAGEDFFVCDINSNPTIISLALYLIIYKWQLPLIIPQRCDMGFFLLGPFPDGGTYSRSPYSLIATKSA